MIDRPSTNQRTCLVMALMWIVCYRKGCSCLVFCIRRNDTRASGSKTTSYTVCEKNVAARVLATYLIPGCVGRGVRLGSENSSGGASGGGGVWKSGNLETWGPGNPEIWGPKNKTNNKDSQNSNLFCPNCWQVLD